MNGHRIQVRMVMKVVKLGRTSQKIMVHIPASPTLTRCIKTINRLGTKEVKVEVVEDKVVGRTGVEVKGEVV